MAEVKPIHLELASLIGWSAKHAQECCEYGDLHGAYMFLELAAHRVKQERDRLHELHKAWPQELEDCIVP